LLVATTALDSLLSATPLARVNVLGHSVDMVEQVEAHFNAICRELWAAESRSL
jgi:hypothetical protein